MKMVVISKVRMYAVILCMLLMPLFSSGQIIKADSSLYGNGQLQWKGKTMTEGDLSYSVELSQYWYENGQFMLATWDAFNSRPKYIDMWLPSGEQILRNGQGVMYEIEYGSMDQIADSIVYQVKDSIKQGMVVRYRLYKGGCYFPVMHELYDQHSELTGKWTYRDTVQGNAFEGYYLNNKKNGPYYSFYLNGSFREKGAYKNDREEGEWLYYDSSGVIIKQCNYSDGHLAGVYRECYANGRTKTKGFYRQGSGYVGISAYNLDTMKFKTYYKKISNKEFKTGTWEYYDRSGNLVKKSHYK